jgi:hypothetical protein
MPRRIRLEPHVAVDELERRYRAAKEPHERSWWQILWLLARGHTALEVAESTGYSRYWIGQIARRYNVSGLLAICGVRRAAHAFVPSRGALGHLIPQPHEPLVRCSLRRRNAYFTAAHHSLRRNRRRNSTDFQSAASR